MARQQARCSRPDTNQEDITNAGAFWLYNRALAATSCGIVISDARAPDNPIIYCNPAFLKITGYSCEEVIGRNCRFLQGKDTDPAAIEQIRQAIQGEQECHVVLKNYRKDGTLFWNDLTISPVSDGSGVVTHFIGVQTDITERKQDEETKQLMQFSIDRAVDAAFFICPDGRLFYVNEAACRSLGYSREQLLSLSIHDIDLGCSPPVWLSHWQKVKQDGSFTIESQHRTKHDRLFPVEITLNYLQFNEQEYICAFARDITDAYRQAAQRQQSEAALQRSEELYRTLAKNFPNGAVLLFDRDLRHLIAEGDELASIGLFKESVEGKTLWAAFTPTMCAAFEPAYRAALAGETTVFEFPYDERIYLIYTLPVTNENGDIFAGMVMTQNITERKQFEKKLRRTNALLKAQQEADLDGILVVNEKGAISSYNRRFCEMWQIPQEFVDSGDQKQILGYVLPLIAEPQRVFSQIERLDENPQLISRDEIPLYNGRVFERDSAPVLSPKGEFYGRIWSFRDITQRKQTETQLRQRARREQLLGGMNQRIRQSLNLDEVLNTTVAEVRQFLECDRTLIYRLNPDGSGTIVVESVGETWTPVLGTTVEDNCFKVSKAPLYQQGRILTVTDIYNAGLKPCHIELLERFQVRANLVVPILQADKLWGLLIAHHCTEARQWQESEVQLLQELSVQLSVAIQQAALFEQLATELKERKAAEAALRESEAALKQQATQLEKALSELKHAQLQLIQTEKMSSLGQLVAGLAHEINNPLTFIDGNISHANKYVHELMELIQLYNKYYPQPAPEIADLTESIDLDFVMEDFPKLLDSMTIGVQRILQIVLSLRNFSRLDEAERKQVNIHEGLENTLLILQPRLNPHSSNIKFVKEYGNLPPVECYPGQLNQVFMNLLNNAIDALEKSVGERILNGSRILPSAESRNGSGLIKISTDVVNSCTTQPPNSGKPQAAQSIVIRIADNGPGIPPQVQEHIFDPFFTTKPVGKGTGLGLSISYQIIVEQHGGQIICCSEPGKGTEFIVKIPVTSVRAKSINTLLASIELG